MPSRCRDCVEGQEVLTTAFRERLGEHAFAASQAEGQAMTRERIVASAREILETTG
jgi:hypothetical protein